MLHYLPNVLRVLQGGNQQSIRGLDHHQIAHAHGRDKLSRSVHVVAVGIQDEYTSAIDQVALRRIALCVMMFVQRGPGAEIVPSEIGGQAKKCFLISRPLPNAARARRNRR